MQKGIIKTIGYEIRWKFQHINHFAMFIQFKMKKKDERMEAEDIKLIGKMSKHILGASFDYVSQMMNALICFSLLSKAI